MALLTVATVILAWLVATTGTCFYFLPDTLRLNGWILSLLFFNNLNIFIAICEIILGYHISFVQEHYKGLLQSKKRGHLRSDWDACVAFLTMPLTLSEVFQGRTWAQMWSTYALYDPSYQNHESFGFFIDVGNGYSTIPPSCLLNVAICRPNAVSNLLVGTIGIASYWQILYGTIIYFFSFLFNRRYQGKGVVEISLFVGLSNG